MTTFATALTEDFRELLDAPNFRHEARDPEPRDFKGSALCFVAVEDERLAAEAAGGGERRRRAGQRRRPAAALRLHHALDRRPQPARHRDFDRRRLADSGPHAEGASGKLHPRRLWPPADLMGGFRGAVAKAIASPIMRRRFWETVLEGPIGERALSGDDNAASAELARAIERAAAENAEAPRGEVYLVGAGPGDPDLLTFRALRLMQKADVVLYDRLTDPNVMNLVRREAERIYVGKQPEDHELPQGEISALMVKLARKASGCCASRAAIRSCSAGAARRSKPSPRRGSRFRSVPGMTAAIGRGGLCRHSAHPSRPRPSLRVRDRPWEGRQDRSRLDGALATAPDGCDLYGAAQPRGADARVHRAWRGPGFASGDHRQRDPANQRVVVGSLGDAGRESARGGIDAGPRSSSSGRS